MRMSTNSGDNITDLNSGQHDRNILKCWQQKRPDSAAISHVLNDSCKKMFEP